MRWFSIVAFVAGCWTNTATPPPVAPVEHHAPVASRPPPPPPSENEVMLQEFEELAERMCGCPDLPCAQGVSEEMTKWAQELANREIEPKMSEVDQKRAMDISTRMSECMSKTMMPPPSP